MHCLAAMRDVLQKAREGEKIGKDETDDFHWPHCFDYLRMVRNVAIPADLYALTCTHRPSYASPILLSRV